MYSLIGSSFSLILLFASSCGLNGQAFVLNGSASVLQGNCYRLTPDSPVQAGSMFSANPIDLTQPFSFSAVLNFGCKNNNGADGMVFILATSNTALGNGGGAIGYEGISPSIAIEFDDYLNGWGDPASDHIAVISNGSVDHNAPTNLFGPFGIAEIEDCADHCFSFDWNPMLQTFTVSLDSDVLTYSIDITNSIFSGNPIVYYGFSAATGSLSNLHTVCIGPPVLVPMEDITICAGESVQLEADPNGVDWLWEFDPTLSFINIMNPIAMPVQNTTYTVNINYACGGFEMDTVEVVLLPAPIATATDNGPLCTGDQLQLMASGGSSYVWTGPQGFYSNNQNPVINNCTPANSGIYTVTVTDAFGCSSIVATSIIVFAPGDVEIEQPSGPICEGSTAIQLNGLPFSGSWSGEIGASGLFDPVIAGVGLHDVYYTFIDGNGCENSAQITIEVLPNTPALIIPDGPFCLTDPVQTLSATPAGGEWGEAADANGQIHPGLLGVGTHQVTYVLSDEDGCFDAVLYLEILPVPEVDIQAVDPFCTNLPTQTLIADPPGGIWSGAANPDGSIDPGLLGTGTYQVIYSYQSPNGCTDSDTMQITVLSSAPQITGLTFLCDSLASSYIISFNIVEGDPLSYAVSGVPEGTLISGNPYMYLSESIPSGSSYSISIDDQNHCDPVTIAGSYSCFCATHAGTMDLTPINACVGDAIIVIASEGVISDTDDSLVYVLHLGNANVLDSIIMISGNGVFPFDTLLEPGVTYYVSAVVGNAFDSGGGVDFSDPCLSVSIGTPVMWMPNPNGLILAPELMCKFDSANLVFVLSGLGPFDIVYSDGLQFNVLNDIVSGHSIPISPAQTTTYSLFQITGQSGQGCSSVGDASVTIVVVEPIWQQQTTMICEGDSIFLGGGIQTNEGLYYDSLTAFSGCDSILETLLFVHAPDTTYEHHTSCDSANTGSEILNFTGQYGCDSTVVTTTVFAESDTSYLSSTTCDLSLSGVFTYQYTTFEGCDSIVIESVQLLPHDTTAISMVTCDSTADGVFTLNLKNQFGCDSIIIETVSFIPPDTTRLASGTCDSTSSGIFTTHYLNINGCDSVVIATILFNTSWFIEVKSVTCDPALSGVFIHSYVTQSGCDSVIAESVELLASDSTFIINSTCVPSDTGAVIVTLENGNGCDSIIYIISHLLPEDTCMRNELVRSVFVPNVFSPNGDGINDDFFVQMNPAFGARIRFLRVFDRWGELVSAKYDFQPNNPVDGWDGMLSGKKLEPGVFVWIAQIEYSDGNFEVLRGDVTLVR